MREPAGDCPPSRNPVLWALVALAATLGAMAIGHHVALDLPAEAEAAGAFQRDAQPRHPQRPAAPQAAHPPAPPIEAPAPREPAALQQDPRPRGIPSGGVCAGVADRIPEKVLEREWPQVAGWCDKVAEVRLATGAEGPEARALVDEVLAVMYCESGGYPGRANRDDADALGEYPIGLMQVSSGWLAGSNWAKARALTLPADLDLYDGRDNLEAARIIWEHFGGWSQWECAERLSAPTGD